MATPPRDALTYLRMEYLSSRPSAAMPVHDWHEIVYVARGRYVVEVAGGMLSAGECEYIYHPANAVHRPQPVDQAMPLLYVLSWREPHTPAVYQRPRLGRDAAGRILMMLRWMWDLHPPADEAAAEALQSLLHLCLAEFLNASVPDLPPAVEQAIRHMRHNLAGVVTLDDLANVSGLSKFHFIRTFRRALGVTPMQHFQAMRVDTALNLLLGTALPIAAIAERVGVANPFHLSRLVRQRTGLSPRALRQRHQRGL